MIPQTPHARFVAYNGDVTLAEIDEAAAYFDAALRRDTYVQIRTLRGIHVVLATDSIARIYCIDETALELLKDYNDKAADDAELRKLGIDSSAHEDEEEDALYRFLDGH